MSKPARPLSESERLQSLRRLDVLDSVPEPGFDALARAAALICGVPISLISLIDEDRQWFKANVGLDGIAETPREVAFCDHAIRGDGIFEVVDACADPRFSDNPLVTSAPDIRFYAGATLRLHDGAHVGTLCVIDRRPRRLNELQREVLSQLAASAVQALEGRRALRAERSLRLAADRLARAVAASEARFHRFSRELPIGVFATNARGQCVYTNPRWQSIHGISLEDSLGDGWMRVLHPEDRARVLNSWQTQRLRELDIDYRIQRPDGEIREVRVRLRAADAADAEPGTSGASLDDELGGHVGSVEDITEARRTERALQDERRRLASIIEGTGAGTWEWNVSTGELVLNERWAALLGMRLDDFGTTTIETWFDRVHPDDLSEMRMALQRHLSRQAEGFSFELRMRHRHGHWVWVKARGRLLTRTDSGLPEWMFGTHRDITPQVMQRQALELAHERLSLATDSGAIGVWEYDLTSGRLSWDAWMYRLYGASAADPSTGYERWARHLHPEDRDEAERSISEALSGLRTLDTAFRILRGDGHVRHLRAAAKVLRDDHGRAQRMIGVNWDVTDLQARQAQPVHPP